MLATDEANSREVILVGKGSLKVMCSLAFMSSKHMDDAGA